MSTGNPGAGEVGVTRLSHRKAGMTSREGMNPNFSLALMGPVSDVSRPLYRLRSTRRPSWAET